MGPSLVRIIRASRIPSPSVKSSSGSQNTHPRTSFRHSVHIYFYEAMMRSEKASETPSSRKLESSRFPRLKAASRMTPSGLYNQTESLSCSRHCHTSGAIHPGYLVSPVHPCFGNSCGPDYSDVLGVFCSTLTTQCS
jgi:hypothetical protein